MRGITKLIVSSALVVGIATIGFFTSSSDLHERRNALYPDTFISVVVIDVTSPATITLKWEGSFPGPLGPFPCSVGAGADGNNCNDPIESNCHGSQCTPKGHHLVQGFQQHLPSNPGAAYVTIIDKKRAIGIHASRDVPPYPASYGCVRTDKATAQLIFSNAIADVTAIDVIGHWTPPPDTAFEQSRAEGRYNEKQVIPQK